MQYVITPFARKVEPFTWWDNGFSAGELDILQNKAKNAGERATVQTGAGTIRTDVRRSSVSWADINPENAWVFKKLAYIGASLNAQYYGFDLTGFGEGLQLTNYDGTEEGMYTWHQDYAALVCRKLTLVVQLSDPSEYEGGELQISTGPVHTVKKQRGFVAAFPSWALHQVTPVTKGTRQSLVAWISGPDFK